MIRFALLPATALAAGLFTLAHPAAAETPAGCWQAFLWSDEAGEYPTEELCADASGAGIRESIAFGAGVTSCSKVRVDDTGAAVRFAVDLSACQGDLPSHVISCPVPMSDENHCALGSGDEKAVLVKSN